MFCLIHLWSISFCRCLHPLVFRAAWFSATNAVQRTEVLDQEWQASLYEVGAGPLRVNDMDITEQEQTQMERTMLNNLTPEQLRLVAAWLHEEATLRATWYSQEVCESIRYMGHRLEILAKG